MKRKLAKFALYVYEKHIQEDWEVYKLPLRIIVWPFWFVRSILIWILCPFLIPEYLFKQSKVYKLFKETGVAPSPEQIKQINKRNTQRFLNKRKN